MKFTLDHKDMFSHLVLNNNQIAQEVAASKPWKEEGILEAKLTINGIEVPAEELDKLLNQMFEQANTEAREAVNADEFEQKVMDKAKELLQNQADNITEVLHNLQCKLEDADNLIKYSWEK